MLLESNVQSQTPEHVSVTRYVISAQLKHKVTGNPSHMLLPYKFFTNITSNIYLQCNWIFMLRHKHQNMYL
jgi:hypothetical protein